MARFTRSLRALAAAVAISVGTAPTAHAAGWTLVVSSGYTYLFGCKTPVDSIYGPLWKVRVFVSNQADHARRASVTVYRHGVVVHQWVGTIAAGATTTGSVYMSRLLPNEATAGVSELSGTGAGGPLFVGELTTC